MPKLVITLNGNSLELDGEPSFIKDNIGLIDTLKLRAVTPRNIQQSESPLIEGEVQAVSVQSDDLALKYPNVFHKDGDNYALLAEPSGSTGAEKTRSLTLLTLLAKKRSVGVGSADSDELRETARKFGCLDAKNFAFQLAGAKPFLAVEGKVGGKKTYMLTIPGEKEAERIAADINKLQESKND